MVRSMADHFALRPGRSDDPHEQHAPVDLALFRRVMGRFATGVTVITAEAEGGVRGMTANAFMSGSLTPPLCVISVAKQARLHGALTAAGHFGVSIWRKGRRRSAGISPARASSSRRCCSST